LVNDLGQVDSRDAGASLPKLRFDFGRSRLARQSGNQGIRVE
jgi:hypothetical protein